MDDQLQQYLRWEKLPHIWCPGCGHGIVMGAMLRAFDQIQLNQQYTTIFSGIGCSSRAAGYLNFDTVHTAHGRAIPFATGFKMVKPEHNVIILSGDGDCTAIGGNHFIHAARRNIDLTVIIFNNNNYGMTGGQYSPLTPLDSKTATSAEGSIEPNFDIAQLAIGAGATFVARGTVYHTKSLIDLLAKAITHKGFSVVEVVSQCPTAYGRRNHMESPVDMMLWQKENAVTIAQAKGLSEEELLGKFVIGILHQHEEREYTQSYEKLRKRIKDSKE